MRMRVFTKWQFFTPLSALCLFVNDSLLIKLMNINKAHVINYVLKI